MRSHNRNPELGMIPLVSHFATARRKLGYSQQDIAYEVGMSRSWVAQLESGRSDPGLRSLCAYAAVLGLEIVLRPVAE
jgi:transcriptional regulator with XRE-family HTH domain